MAALVVGMFPDGEVDDGGWVDDGRADRRSESQVPVMIEVQETIISTIDIQNES